MIIMVNDFKVQFFHDVSKSKFYVEGKKIIEKREAVSCEIWDIKISKLLATDLVTRNVKDVHNKSVARKESLTKTLKKSSLSKTDRKAIWVAFFQNAKSHRKLLKGKK